MTPCALLRPFHLQITRQFVDLFPVPGGLGLLQRLNNTSPAIAAWEATVAGRFTGAGDFPLLVHNNNFTASAGKPHIWVMEDLSPLVPQMTFYLGRDFSSRPAIRPAFEALQVTPKRC